MIMELNFFQKILKFLGLLVIKVEEKVVYKEKECTCRHLHKWVADSTSFECEKEEQNG